MKRPRTYLDGSKGKVSGCTSGGGLVLSSSWKRVSPVRTRGTLHVGLSNQLPINHLCTSICFWVYQLVARGTLLSPGPAICPALLHRVSYSLCMKRRHLLPSLSCFSDFLRRIHCAGSPQAILAASLEPI